MARLSFLVTSFRWIALLGLTIGIRLTAQAQPAAGRPLPVAWAENPAAQHAAAASPYAGWLRAYRALTLDAAALRPLLATAPLEGSPAAQAPGAGIVLTLPAPDGTAARFRLVEAPVLAPSVAAHYPQIRTYAGVGLDDPTAALRCDLTPLGFHAQVLSARTGAWFVEPLSPDDVTHYVSFAKSAMDYAAARGGREACGFRPTPLTVAPNAARPSAASATRTPAPAQRALVESGTTLRTYRLCVAATQEYVAARGGAGTARQKKVRAVAAIVTSVNRVTGVYEKELAVRLVLIAGFDTVVYVTPDPYTNSDVNAMLSQNQTNLTNVIGSANYDIGHVFSTGGGGIASLGSVCQPSAKAQGVTGLMNPVGDAFDIDYVAHEMGHQFGGNHPFNGTEGACAGGNRNANTAWEPGSGSTIMAYAGICAPQDLQNNSDPYFHTGTFEEIMNFIVSTGTCPAQQATGNTPPVVTAPANRTIPKNTPFRLTASATDAEGDALTYDWEELDLGPAGAPITNTTVQTPGLTPPLLRSFPPTVSPTGYFPRLNELIKSNPASWARGVALPSVARTLQFRCTARDQHLSAPLGLVVGGVAYSALVTLTVDSVAGPFTVTQPNTIGLTWATGSPQTVTWAVAGTAVAPVSCATVDILLSRNGGLTYPTVLATGLPNTGTASVTVPLNTPAAPRCRIMVAAADHYFFDISNANFALTAPLGTAPDAALNAALTVAPNPGSGIFRLALPTATTTELTLTITDALGRAVQTTPLWAVADGLHYALDLTAQPAGIYLLRLTTVGGRTVIRRLVKL